MELFALGFAIGIVLGIIFAAVTLFYIGHRIATRAVNTQTAPTIAASIAHQMMD